LLLIPTANNVPPVHTGFLRYHKGKQTLIT